ncbi:hypothetical protein NPIL_210761, partial [Nephila pilipes]
MSAAVVLPLLSSIAPVSQHYSLSLLDCPSPTLTQPLTFCMAFQIPVSQK